VISAQFLESHLGISPTRIGRFAGISKQSEEGELLIAMQKVVGSNPISRFAKGPQLRAFSVLAVGWTFCVGPD
jgi:hypothetical protein